MNSAPHWFTETWHIFKKDVQQMRWALAVFAAFVGAITVAACMPATGRKAPSSFLPTMVLLACIVIAASIMHMDSPVVPTAFWRSRPQRPASTVASKMALIAIALFGIPALAQCIALFANGARGLQLFPLLLPSLRPLAVMLYASFILGTLTPGLKSFALAAITGLALLVLPFVAMLGGTFSNTSFAVHVSRTGVLFAVISSVCALATVVAAYARPLRAHRALLVLFAVVTPFAVLAAVSAGSSEVSVRELPVAERVQVKVNRVDWIPMSDPGMGFLGISFGFATQVPGMRAWMMLSRCEAITLKNERVPLQCPPYFEPINVVPPFDIDADARWIRWEHRYQPISISAPDTFPHAQSLTQPGTRLVFDGELYSIERDTVIEVPFNARTEFALDAVHFTAQSEARPRPLRSDSLYVATFDAQGVSARQFSELSQEGIWRYGFYNRGRHEAIEARLSDSESSIRALILFGPVSQSGIARFSAIPDDRNTNGSQNGATPVLDSAWYRDTHFVASKWMPKYKHPVHVEYVVPQP